MNTVLQQVLDNTLWQVQHTALKGDMLKGRVPTPELAGQHTFGVHVAQPRHAGLIITWAGPQRQDQFFGNDRLMLMPSASPSASSAVEHSHLHSITSEADQAA